MRKLVLVFLSSLILGVAIAAAPEQSPVVAYQFAKASSGEAATKVIAAGTVQPIVSVVVSSQVSGQVKEILVDHNDAVKEGQPIALLEPELFNTRVDQARAEVDIASDAVRIAQEEVTTAQAVVNRATADRAKAEADSKRYEVTVGLTRQHLDRKSVLGAGPAIRNPGTGMAILAAVVTATLVTLISALYPARKAARLDPADALAQS